MNEDEHAYFWKLRHALLERIEISVRYHQKRERFFELFDKWVKVIAIIGGSVAFASLALSDGMRKTVAALIALSSTLALVFGFTDRTKKHAELARKFRELEAKITSKGERGYQESDFGVWEGERGLLEATEPPALNALVTICQNEIFVANGQREKIVHIPLYQKIFSQFLSF
jgi:hypothetical protein